MIVQVLGCSGSIAAGCRTTSFLLDDDVLVDAGTGVGDLPLEALARIEHIVVSHSHLDHVVSIGLLADSVMRAARGRGPRRRSRCTRCPQTLAALRTHIFNGVIWPDFTRLPSAEHPVLAAGAVRRRRPAGARRQARSRCSAPRTPCRRSASRSMAAPAGWWVFTGDTGPNPALWQRLQRMQRRAPRDRDGLQRRGAPAGAHQPAPLPGGARPRAAHLQGSVDVHITHIKPGEHDSVMAADRTPSARRTASMRSSRAASRCAWNPRLRPRTGTD